MIVGTEAWEEDKVTVVESHAKEWVKEDKTYTYKELLDTFGEDDLVYILVHRLKVAEAELKRRYEVHTGLGSPSHRLKYVLDELKKRFPDVHDTYMSDAPEHKYFTAIDRLLDTRKDVEDMHYVFGNHLREAMRIYKNWKEKV